MMVEQSDLNASNLILEKSNMLRVAARSGRSEVVTSKIQGSVLNESTITKNGKLSICKNHNIGVVICLQYRTLG